MVANEQIQINVWSDYVCPYCYLEEPILEQLQQEYSEVVKIEWRAFELRPEPIPTLDPNGEYLHTTWEKSVYPMAKSRGMILRLPPLQPRSRKALEAAEFARTKNRFAEMHHALFRAFFEDGLDLNNLDILSKIGHQVGLESAELRTALEINQFTKLVLEDQALAQKLGISGVPAMLISVSNQPLENAVMISGAQPYEFLKAQVDRILQAG